MESGGDHVRTGGGAYGEWGMIVRTGGGAYKE